MAPNKQTDDTASDRIEDDPEPEPEQPLTWTQRRRLEREQ